MIKFNIKYFFKFILIEIAYNGHLQTIGSLSIAIFSAQLFNIKIGWDFLAIIYFGLYIVYIYNRWREINIDYLTNKIRTEHIKKFDKYIPHIIIISFLILLYLLFIFSTIKFSFFFIVIIILGLLYTDYFKKLTRKIFIFKNFYVASAFAILITFPFIYYAIPFKGLVSYIIVLMIFAFFRGIYMQIILDLKDIKSDGREGLLTLGVLRGKDKTLKILKILSIITAGLVPLFIFFYFNLSSSILTLALLIVFDFYIIHLIKKDNFLAYILESGEFILWPILIFLGDKII